MQDPKQLARERVGVYQFNRMMSPFYYTWDNLPPEEAETELRWYRWHRAADRALRAFRRQQQRGRR